MSFRWEFGSEFHWPLVTEAAVGPVLPPDAVLFASGRDAIRGVIRAGKRVRGWRRWMVPTYFCEEVTECIAAAGIEIVRYEDSPLLPTPPPLKEAPRAGDALLLVNYFGLRGAGAADAFDYAPADLIEDHTHDPWSTWARGSQAHYCIASLRKTLPIPGGGVVWSPQRLPLPNQVPPTQARRSAILMKLGAMAIKALYLEGQAVRKETYRELQLCGEEQMISGAAAGMDPLVAGMLTVLPWGAWRQQRRANHTVLAEALQKLPDIELLPIAADEGSCPFAVAFLLGKRSLRDSLVAALLVSSIYPSVLWPIDARDRPILGEAERLSGRILTFACDFRYKSADLLAVAAKVGAILKATCVKQCRGPGKLPKAR